MNIGRRHWASHALIHCNAAECAQQLRQMLDQQQPDVLQGAMGIVSNVFWSRAAWQCRCSVKESSWLFCAGYDLGYIHAAIVLEQLHS